MQNPIIVSAKDITVSPIAPFRDGDWHDRPFRYAVNGPGKEVQNFPTKREANKYRSVRRRSATQLQAIFA